MIIGPTRDRLIKELDDLKIKHKKLEIFILSDKYNKLDTLNKTLLKQQCEVMAKYAVILIQRLHA